MIVTINVTQEDIDGGCRYDVMFCMLARAMTRATGLFAEVSCCFFCLFDGPYLGPYDTYEEPRPQLLFGGTLPLDVVEKRSAFDRGEPVEPFSFDLDIPESVLRK